MSITEILFWGLSVLALFSAIMVVASKNPVHSILFLIVVFFTISGHYVLLNAQFLAIVNIIVYASTSPPYECPVREHSERCELLFHCGWHREDV
jgi:hypothetical protein